MAERTAETDQICRECWERALYAFATASVFDARARRYHRLIRWLLFLGIIVPVLIGAVVVSFGVRFHYLTYFVWIAGILGILQLMGTVVSAVFNWDEKFGYARVSAADNFDLSTKFRELGNEAFAPRDNLAFRVAVLKSRDDSRRQSDAMQEVTEKEKRFGHRAGLRHFQRKCEGCHQVPTSMKASECEICGRF